MRMLLVVGFRSRFDPFLNFGKGQHVTVDLLQIRVVHKNVPLEEEIEGVHGGGENEICPC